MRRSTIGLVFTLALLTAPLAAEAQQPGKVYRVGLVFTTSRSPKWRGLIPTTRAPEHSCTDCARSAIWRGET